MTVSLQGLISGQMYYCTAAGTDANSSSCGGPVVGGVESYFNISAGNVVLWAHSSGFVYVVSYPLHLNTRLSNSPLI